MSTIVKTLSIIKKLVRKLNLLPAAKGYIYRSVIEPSRSATGSFLCTLDRIASRKNGCTQNSEYRDVELRSLLAFEFNPDVKYYFDQPEQLKISYVNKDDKKVVVWYTPDFMLVSEDGITLVECKTEDWLKSHCVSHPNRFVYDKSLNTYRDLSAEAAASELGFTHVIFTNRTFTGPFTRNCIFLLNFIDELSLNIGSDHNEDIADYIRQTGNKVLLEDLQQVFDLNDIVRAIFSKTIFMDLNRDLLCHPKSAWIYVDKAYLNAIQHLKQNLKLAPAQSINDLTNLAGFWWVDQEWEVLNVSTNPEISMTARKGNRTVQFTQHEIVGFISRQDWYIETFEYSKEAALDALCNHPHTAIEEGINRVAELSGKKTGRPQKSKRTHQRWAAKTRHNEQDNLIALLPKTHLKGNRTSRLSQHQETLLEEAIQRTLEPSAPRTHQIYLSYLDKCKTDEIKPCSLNTFYRRIRKIEKGKRVFKKQGFKAAYALGPSPLPIDLDWDLPYHGDFTFEIGHVDHTPLEIKLASKLTGEPLEGTLNLSLLYDAHSRMILAVFLSFEKPSYRATMVLLRECYRRFKRLPLFLAVDHGPDFKSNYFDKTLATLGMHKRNRPKSASRHGSTIERVFGTIESEFIHTLSGNKQLQKLGRGLSTTHKPEKFAIWTPDEFETAFKDYAYLVHPEVDRKGIFERPKDRYERSLSNFSEHPGTKIASETDFFIQTLPPVDGDGKRALRKNQIEFKGLNYLLSNKVPGYSGERIRVPVKYNPYNVQHIWALISNRWVKLTTNNELVRECHDKGVRLAYMEVYSRSLRTARSRQKGSKKLMEMHQRNTQKQQYLFNLKQGQIGNPENEAEDIESFSSEAKPVTLDTSTLLPVTVLEDQ